MAVDYKQPNPSTGHPNSESTTQQPVSVTTEEISNIVDVDDLIRLNVVDSPDRQESAEGEESSEESSEDARHDADDEEDEEEEEGSGQRIDTSHEQQEKYDFIDIILFKLIH